MFNSLMLKLICISILELKDWLLNIFFLPRNIISFRNPYQKNLLDNTLFSHYTGVTTDIPVVLNNENSYFYSAYLFICNHKFSILVGIGIGVGLWYGINKLASNVKDNLAPDDVPDASNADLFDDASNADLFDQSYPILSQNPAISSHLHTPISTTSTWTHPYIVPYLDAPIPPITIDQYQAQYQTIWSHISNGTLSNDLAREELLLLLRNVKKLTTSPEAIDLCKNIVETLIS